MAAKHRRPRSTGSRLATGLVAAVAVTAVAASTVAVVNRLSVGASDGSTAAAATESVGHSTSTAVTSTPAKPTTPSPVAVPLHLLTAAPDGTQPVSGAVPIVLTFDEPVATSGVLPTIEPTTPGNWSQPSPDTLRFDPAVPFLPDTPVTVDVPTGMRAVNGGLLTTATTFSYHVADGSLLRLQQLLAELRYLPVNFTPTTPETNTASAQGEMAFDPPAGTFAMRFPSTPQALTDLWEPDSLTPMTSGAIMAFENVHHLKVDGVAGPAVWSALLQDAVSTVADPQPYTWAWTTMSRPETLQIWSNGTFVFSSKANTGIPAAPTPKGSWPVFARYRTQTMKGTNPDGTKYNDPGVPYISYFHEGDAIHGFQRASYGSQQSLGCVELPYSAAAQVWDLIDYGTVVTVTS